jgi:hypothetical protein
LLQIELIDRADDVERGKQAEHAELPDENIPVLVLERVVERLVPGVEPDIQPDLEELEADDRDEQNAAGPAVLRAEIGDRDARKLTGGIPKSGQYAFLQAAQAN